MASKKDTPAEPKHGDEVVMLQVNGWYYYVPLRFALPLLEAFSHAEQRVWDSSINNNNGGYLAKPIGDTNVTVASVHVGTYYKEKFAWEEKELATP